jgi:hypothetical protein
MIHGTLIFLNYNYQYMQVSNRALVHLVDNAICNTHSLICIPRSKHATNNIHYETNVTRVIIN